MKKYHLLFRRGKLYFNELYSRPRFRQRLAEGDKYGTVFRRLCRIKRLLRGCRWKKAR
jgi:hypothetical protein